MLDFKELPKDGTDFELLIRELLFACGLRVYWSGKGPDGGRDLLCIEEPVSKIATNEKRWLVQCKHFANSSKSVGVDDLDDIVTSCTQHSAEGYLLVCSTQPSSAVVTRLEAISNNPAVRITTAYWDYVTIERLLSSPKTWPIAQRFFPVSSEIEPWRVYATESPNHWVVNFKGYYFHLLNRIGSNSDLHLNSIRKRVDEIESIKLPQGHFFRLRAIYYDDKHGSYKWYIDYLYPQNEDPKLNPYVLKNYLGDGYAFEDGLFYEFDIHLNQYFKYSDHHDIDHYDYYKPYMADFKIGHDRKQQYEVKIGGGKTQLLFEPNYENLIKEKFEKMVNAFSKLDYVHIVRVINSSIEHIDKFYHPFNWSKVLTDISIEPDLFFSARILFTSTNFEDLTSLISKFPLGINEYFKLSKRYVFLPESGLQEDEDLYELTFSIHPALIKNKIDARSRLDKYFEEITNIVTSHNK